MQGGGRYLVMPDASGRTRHFHSTNRSCHMNWDRIEGNWKEFRGKAKTAWGKLTDDDLDVVGGRRDQLEGRLQAQYGYAKDKARTEVDSWLRNL
jgi:uncharacterized protein YjbJ (UPF0337 family)